MECYEKIKNQRGVIFVITAILIIPFLLFVGIALDFGLIYVERGKLQDTADAAAMAGANKATSEGQADAKGNLAQELVRAIKLNDGAFNMVAYDNSYCHKYAYDKENNGEIANTIRVFLNPPAAALVSGKDVFVEYCLSGPIQQDKISDVSSISDDVLNTFKVNDRVRVRLTKKVPTLILHYFLSSKYPDGVPLIVSAAASYTGGLKPTDPTQALASGLPFSGRQFYVYCGAVNIDTPDNYIGVLHYPDNPPGSDDMAKFLDSTAAYISSKNLNLPGNDVWSYKMSVPSGLTSEEKNNLRNAGYDPDNLTAHDIFMCRKDDNLRSVFEKSLINDSTATCLTGGTFYKVWDTENYDDSNKRVAEIWYIKDGQLYDKGRYYSTDAFPNDSYNSTSSYFYEANQYVKNIKAEGESSKTQAAAAYNNAVTEANKPVNKFKSGSNEDGVSYRYISVEKNNENNYVVNSNIKSGDNNIDLYISIGNNCKLSMDNSWLNGVTTVNNLYVTTPGGMSFNVDTSDVVYNNIYGRVDTCLTLGGSNNTYKGAVYNGGNGHVEVLGENSKFPDGFHFVTGENVELGRGYLQSNENVKNVSVSGYSSDFVIHEVSGTPTTKSDMTFKIGIGEGAGGSTPITPQPSQNKKIQLLE